MSMEISKKREMGQRQSQSMVRSWKGQWQIQTEKKQAKGTIWEITVAYPDQ